MSRSTSRRRKEFALSIPAILTVGIKKIITPFAFERIHFDGDFVTGVEEKPNFEIMALAGIYVMKPAIFELIPKDHYFGMDTLIRTMLARQIPVAKYNIEEYWLDIGQIPDYERAQEVYREHFAGA